MEGERRWEVEEGGGGLGEEERKKKRSHNHNNISTAEITRIRRKRAAGTSRNYESQDATFL